VDWKNLTVRLAVMQWWPKS